MRVAIAAAAFEAVLVLLWIACFVDGGVIGSPHQFWYAEFPLVFLAIPLLVAGVAIKIGSGEDGWHELAYFVLALLLLGNVIAFLAYATLSGGGV
jgi:hypothetical protein